MKGFYKTISSLIFYMLTFHNILSDKDNFKTNHKVQ